MKYDSQSLISTVRQNRSLTVLVIALLGFLVATIVSIVWVQRDAQRDQQFLQYTAELRAL